jgi:hypothetical protein
MDSEEYTDILKYLQEMADKFCMDPKNRYVGIFEILKELDVNMIRSAIDKIKQPRAKIEYLLDKRNEIQRKIWDNTVTLHESTNILLNTLEQDNLTLSLKEALEQPLFIMRCKVYLVSELEKILVYVDLEIKLIQNSNSILLNTKDEEEDVSATRSKEIEKEVIECFKLLRFYENIQKKRKGYIKTIADSIKPIYKKYNVHFGNKRKFLREYLPLIRKILKLEKNELTIESIERYI